MPILCKIGHRGQNVQRLDVYMASRTKGSISWWYILLASSSGKRGVFICCLQRKLVMIVSSWGFGPCQWGSCSSHKSAILSRAWSNPNKKNSPAETLVILVLVESFGVMKKVDCVTVLLLSSTLPYLNLTVTKGQETEKKRNETWQQHKRENEGKKRERERERETKMRNWSGNVLGFPHCTLGSVKPRQRILRVEINQ